jgi:hypothetical protein
MLINMERIEAMSDEELTKVSNEDMARFMCTHVIEKMELMRWGGDMTEDEMFSDTMSDPGLIEKWEYREWFYRTVRHRQRELKEAKEDGEALDRSCLKDLNDRIKPEIVCFDLRDLSPRQKEALYQLIDDNPDLTRRWWYMGPTRTVTLASKSMQESRA